MKLIEGRSIRERWLLAAPAVVALIALPGCANNSAEPVVGSPVVTGSADQDVVVPDDDVTASAAAGPTVEQSATPSATASASKSALASEAKKPVTDKPSPNRSSTKVEVKVPTAAISPRISVSKVTGLGASGETVRVTGSGFDMTKGIYVAFCVKPPEGQAPGPCGGGADTDGNSGASEWISSNPPTYGKSLVKPYGAGGTFSVVLRVSPKIGNVDCTTSTCVVATRADHTRSSDRSQDVLIPVSFVGKL